jgi:hypothetical protein
MGTWNTSPDCHGTGQRIEVDRSDMVGYGPGMCPRCGGVGQREVVDLSPNLTGRGSQRAAIHGGGLKALCQLVGFAGTGLWAGSITQPNWIVPLVVAAIAGYLAGRLYKLVVISALAAAAWLLLGRAP